MLAMFKDQPSTELNTPPVLDWARVYWRKNLDKGVPPTTQMIQQEWLKEYPHVSEAVTELNHWSEILCQHTWLNHFLQLTSVREIFAHGPNLIEAVGDNRQTVTFPLEIQDWELWLETLATQVRAEFNFSRPCTSTYWLHEGVPWRVTLVHSSLAPGSFPKVFLRRLAAIPYSLENYGLDARGVQLLQGIMANRENLLVAGSTGSGKTSFLSSITQHCDDSDHVVLLEDTQELSSNATRLTRLLANEHLNRSLSDLLAHTLRLSPDRIILGEMRSHEVVPFLLAMNTGHKGVMGTLHASSAVDALHRVAQLFTLASGRKEMDYKEVLRLVSKNVSVVVFLEKRKVKQIIRIYGCEEGQPIYDVIWEQNAL